MTATELDEAELYLLVRKAVADAIWGVLGTIALVLTSSLLVLVGATALVNSATAPTANSWLPAIFGVTMIGVGLLAIARELGIWPFQR